MLKVRDIKTTRDYCLLQCRGQIIRNYRELLKPENLCASLSGVQCRSMSHHRLRRDVLRIEVEDVATGKTMMFAVT